MKTLVILTALCFVLAGISFAGNVIITEVVTGGTLTLTMPSAFSLSGVTVGGADSQDATGDATYTVEDSRGSGAGWNLGLAISQFVTAGTPQRSIQTANFEVDITAPDIACTYGQAVDGTNGPKTVLSGYTEINGSETECVHALANYGMGKYTINATHILAVDADRYAGTYTATMTATLNATP